MCHLVLVFSFGLKVLADFKQLTSLDLMEFDLSPALCKQLATMNHLETLFLEATMKNSDLRWELQEALPRCDIIER